MKSYFALLLAVAGLGIVPSIAPAIPLSSFEMAQAGQVIASVNPNQPIRIEVVNGGDATIVCRLTQPASAERLLPPGGTTAFGSTTTQFIPPPVYFVAYPQGDSIGLSMDVFTSGNTVTIIIGEQLSDTPGRTSVSIAANGAVSVY
ncbi:hypothetical protein C7B61_03375 [filamentous cyanobacterium CCP1]|nr:hypothetical protein C7B76_05025 [filamentous cyanobacterium CCP2]PSB67964.1 hypothetical protein C7B61_03375 [filamentous cyanobacterium CCP1]